MWMNNFKMLKTSKTNLESLLKVLKAEMVLQTDTDHLRGKLSQRT
jgi:hypothetical protein